MKARKRPERVDPITGERERKKPGRPPKYPYGTITKTFRIPKDLDKKLKADVEAGKFDSETEAIYFYVMNAGELDRLAGEIARLKRELELKEAEIQALRKRVEVLEREKAEALTEAEEWERRYRELEAKLAETFVSVGGEKEKEAGEMGAEDLISELERIDLVEVAKEYYRLSEALINSPGNYLVRVDGEWVKRREVEAKVEELRDKINKVLDLRGISRPQAWKLISAGKLEDLRKLLEG